MSQHDAPSTTAPAAHRRRAWRSAAGAAVAGLLVLTPAATPAQAAPPLPSEQEVDAAQRATDGAAAQVAALESRLAAASADLEQSQQREAQAVELHHVAQGELERRAAAADQAQAAAADARAGAETARAAVGRLAAGSYRSGGDFAGISAFLTSAGPQDLLDRAALLDALGERRERVRDQMDATEVVARLLDEQAQQAAGQQQDAARAAQDASTAAAASAEAARSQVVASASARAALIEQLAALRGTSVALEQRRQDGLEAQQREQQEAVARADRRQRQDATRTGSASTTAGAAGTAGSGSALVWRGTGVGADAPARPAAPAPAAPSAPPAPPVPTTPTVPSGGSSGSSSAGQAALEWARAQIGKPYVWGGSGPDGFDCSGLTSQAWRAAGVSLPRTSRDQYRRVQKISYDQLRPGDLVFYGDDPDDAASITHVAIYAGGQRMVEAPQTGMDVRETALRMNRSMAWAGRP